MSIQSIPDFTERSLSQVLPHFQDSERIVVYGWGDCRYTQLMNDLRDRIKKPSEDAGSQPQPLRYKPVTADKPEDLMKSSKRVWKTNLVNLVLENYVRKQEGKPLIPLLFVIESESPPEEGERYTSSKTVTSKDAPHNTRITNSEMRRLYKLCYELGDDELSEELQAVAREMVHFVKVVSNKATTDKGKAAGKFKVESVQPYWTSISWEREWKKRRADKAPESLNQSVWIKQLKDHAKEYIEAHKKEQSSVPGRVISPKSPKESPTVCQEISSLFKNYKDLPILHLEEPDPPHSYIDFIRPEQVTHPVMRGMDKHGRNFFVIKAMVGDELRCQVFFQRYASEANTWAVADVVGMPRIFSIDAYFMDKGDMGLENNAVYNQLQELLSTGKVLSDDEVPLISLAS